MKFSFLFFFFFSSLSIAADCKGDLKMTVTGLKSSQGQVKFDLDASPETFKPKENAKPSFMKGKAVVSDQKAFYVFKDVPCGEYAIKLYHDENMNEDLDKNFIKVPKEDYTFSNCPGCLIPPSWEKAKFRFDLEHPEIKISL